MEKARSELAVVQQQLSTQWSDSLQVQEKIIMQYLEKWSMIEESIMKQKFRVQRIHPGDSNTKYFTVVMKDKIQRKQINEFTFLGGVVLTDTKEIQEEIISFYKGLMGTNSQNLPSVNKLVMQKGTSLSQEQRIKLLEPVIEDEIQNSLNAIGDDKSPGVDGFNVVLFKNHGTLLNKR